MDLLGEALAAETVLAGPAPKGLGRAMQGGGDKVHRQASDFYPTPAAVTRALLRKESQCLANVAPGPVWEPCGRGWAIIRELRHAGFETIGSDLVPDSAHGVAALDLLDCRRPLARKVVTNPPFALAPAMIGHLLDQLKVDYLALLLKSQFWHAEERRGLFRRHRPARIWALTWRPDFMELGAPTMDVVWVVWQRGIIGTQYDLLPREAEAQGDLL